MKTYLLDISNFLRGVSNFTKYLKHFYEPLGTEWAQASDLIKLRKFGEYQNYYYLGMICQLQSWTIWQNYYKDIGAQLIVYGNEEAEQLIR